jgi:tRNA-splicing ligase RtcB
MELVREGLNRYRLPRRGKMRVDGIVYVNEKLKRLLKEDKSLEQLADAASLPGVVDPVVGMPDIHEGFGLPIGGVMAVDPDGVISAGAVGMDINCGVRLIRTDLVSGEFTVPQLRKLMDRVEDYVPTGVGKKGRQAGATARLFEQVVHEGVRALIDGDYAVPQELEYIEENGCLAGADLGAVSPTAVKRGALQLGTLGGGNHFIEFQEVTEVFDREVAGEFGLFPGQFTVMIHTGSRGFGHQICTDFSKSLLPVAKKYGIELPSKGLACAPVESPEGRAYFAAMACAVNFAFANRQVIMQDVMRVLADVLGPAERLGIRLVYDVAHNIAKWETHHNRRVLVHRKGATRALPAGHGDNPRIYRGTGHPVLIPGSMGTASYILVGTDQTAASYYSANHGAGRTLSRTAAARSITRDEFEKSMGEVLYNTRNYRDIVDEAPLAYKNIDEVVDTLAAINMTRLVARLRPLAVIKGKD